MGRPASVFAKKNCEDGFFIKKRDCTVAIFPKICYNIYAKREAFEKGLLLMKQRDTLKINAQGHLEIGGMDAVALGSHCFLFQSTDGQHSAA